MTKLCEILHVDTLSTRNHRIVPQDARFAEPMHTRRHIPKPAGLPAIASNIRHGRSPLHATRMLHHMIFFVNLQRRLLLKDARLPTCVSE
jgi:hypothetical protein